MTKSTLLLFIIIVVLALGAVEASSHKKPDDVLATKCTGKHYKVTRAEHEANQRSWIGCEFNRSDVVEKANTGYDLNGDGLICVDEMVTLMHHYLTPVEIILLSNIESIETIMYKCDCDNDGCISAWDFANTMDNCVATCNVAHRVQLFIGRRVVEGDIMGEVRAPKPIDDDILYEGHQIMKPKK